MVVIISLNNPRDHTVSNGIHISGVITPARPLEFQKKAEVADIAPDTAVHTVAGTAAHIAAESVLPKDLGIAADTALRKEARLAPLAEPDIVAPLLLAAVADSAVVPAAFLQYKC